jgi:hypothetical protein
MTLGFEFDGRPARLDEIFGQDLAQFEPDPDGDGSIERAATAGARLDDPQWVVWTDAAAACAWAAAALRWTRLPWPPGPRSSRLARIVRTASKRCMAR